MTWWIERIWNFDNKVYLKVCYQRTVILSILLGFSHNSLNVSSLIFDVELSLYVISTGRNKTRKFHGKISFSIVTNVLELISFLLLKFSLLRQRRPFSHIIQCPRNKVEASNGKNIVHVWKWPLKPRLEATVHRHWREWGNDKVLDPLTISRLNFFF